MTYRIWGLGFALAAPVVAQTTWNVPSAGNLTAYITQAAPGDILNLAAGGAYGPVTVNKGVSILGNGAFLSNTTFQVPQGQKASLVNVRNQGIGDGAITMTVLSGLVELSAINSQPYPSYGTSLDIRGGEVVIQGLFGSITIRGGRCWVTDASLKGTNAVDWSVVQFPATAGILQSGGEIRLSHCSITGGNGLSYWDYGSSNPTLQWIHAATGIRQTAGLLQLADCTVTGGAGNSQFDGEVAIRANGNFTVARSTHQEGYNCPVTSSGWQPAEEMVGITANQPPIRGASFTATGLAGNSQGPMGLVGGFQRSSSTVPPVVEPLFGDPAQLVTLAIGTPPAGGTLATTVSVPNSIGLVGWEVWLQALQLVGPTIRASTVVGGTIR